MACLLDTSILVRLADEQSASRPTAVQAVVVLARQGERLCVASQNLIEFYAVATRPRSVNGLGLNRADADRRNDEYEARFVLLPDSPAIYPAWKTVVRTAGVAGKRVHDARLAAVCQVHGVGSVLTFNVTDFAGLVPGLLILPPAQVAARLNDQDL